MEGGRRSAETPIVCPLPGRTRRGSGGICRARGGNEIEGSARNFPQRPQVNQVGSVVASKRAELTVVITQSLQACLGWK